MIAGTVTAEGEPLITMVIAEREWPAVIDTGFNGDLQLPDECRKSLKARWAGRSTWLLANNQSVEEDRYLSQVEFDGDVIPVMIGFCSAAEILIGTHLLRRHRLNIDFVARTVFVERVHPSA